MIVKKIGLITNDRIDEEKVRSASGKNIKIITIAPLSYLNEMVDKILIEEVDALIVDYDLRNDHHTLYQGAEVIRRIEEQKEGFPLFLIVDDQGIEQAEKEVDNVHLVYGKERVFTNVGRFLERISRQIEKEKQKIQAQEARLLQLMHRIHSLSAQEESEINALNFSLEKGINKRRAKDLSAITSSSQKKLANILAKTDEILHTLNKS
ncbi:MAG: hypothetical protein AAF770_00060 [Bacteroidota bacterium]